MYRFGRTPTSMDVRKVGLGVLSLLVSAVVSLTQGLVGV